MACRCIDEEIHPDVDGSLSAALCSVLCDVDETIVTRKILQKGPCDLGRAKRINITKVKIRYYLRAKMAFKISFNWPSGFFVTKPKVTTPSRAYRQRHEEFFMGHVYLTSLD
ncbi:hypothetical protein V1478_008255 [Vespula squamosa]|uniref:Uncharacterized protein n=1 Tax=Vespula squamosa TaxID=30214 RepID=A0ABD2AYA9_VESSQ